MINIPLLKRLCMANGISGDEGAVRELIIEEIKGYADYTKRAKSLPKTASCSPRIWTRLA